MEQQLQINQYKKLNHSVGKIMMHLEWCTKYRYKMFGKFKYKNLITACIRRAASLHQIEMIEINVQPEHVHCVVSVSFTFSASKVLQLLKGISAKLFFWVSWKSKIEISKGAFVESRKICIQRWICPTWNRAELCQDAGSTSWKPHTLVCWRTSYINKLSIKIR